MGLQQKLVEDMDNLKNLVNKLAYRKSERLDSTLLYNLKNVCKKSNFHILKLVEFLLSLLKKKHAGIRLNCLRICDEIFKRSHCFRFIFLRNYELFSGFIFISQEKDKLKPTVIAKKLEIESIVLVDNWSRIYGHFYPSLYDFKNYLTHSKYVDFDEMKIITPANRKAILEEKILLENQREGVIIRVQHDFDSLQPEIIQNINTMKNCVGLLTMDLKEMNIPLFTDQSNQELVPIEVIIESIFIRNSAESKENKGSNVTESSERVVSFEFEHLQQIIEDDNNEPIILHLKELMKTAIRTHLPQMNVTHRNITIYREQHVELFDKVDSLFISLKKSIDVYSNMKLITKTGTQYLYDTLGKSEDDAEITSEEQIEIEAESNSDYDFIDVEDSSNDAVKAEIDLLSFMLQEEKAVAKTTHNSSQIPNSETEVNKLDKTFSNGKRPSKMKDHNKVKKTKGSSTPESFLKDIPDGRAPSLHINPMAGLSQVWTGSNSSDVDDSNSKLPDVLGISTRRIDPDTITSSHPSDEEDLFTCRAPLPSGRLCPRKDLKKCPHHGSMMFRDKHTGYLDIQLSSELKRRIDSYYVEVHDAVICSTTERFIRFHVSGREFNYSHRSAQDTLEDMKKFNIVEEKKRCGLDSNKHLGSQLGPSTSRDYTLVNSSQLSLDHSNHSIRDAAGEAVSDPNKYYRLSKIQFEKYGWL